MTDREGKIPEYLKYPYDRFLKLRIEFLILTQNDLESRIMRIIERCIENERFRLSLTAANAGREITAYDMNGIFVPISHRFFLQELYGLVQSETTLRDALAHLEEMHLIIRRPGGSGPYDPPLYTLNKPLIEYLFTLFPPTLNELDMNAIMKQPRKPRKPKEEEEESETGVQILEVQKLHPLVDAIRGAIIGPPDPQLLDPYPLKNCTPLTLTGVQKLDPRRYKENTKKRERKNTVTPNVIEPDTLSIHSSNVKKSSEEPEPLSQETVQEEKSEEHHQDTEPDKKVFTLEDLTPEEKRLHDLVITHGVATSMHERPSDQIPAKLKEDYSKLAPDVPTEHAFLSLFAFAQARLVGKSNPTVFVGNMVSNRIAWKQTYKPPQQKNSTRPLTEMEQRNQELMKKFSINYDQLYRPSARRDTHHG